jgi:hypothetical protein
MCICPSSLAHALSLIFAGAYAGTAFWPASIQEYVSLLLRHEHLVIVFVTNAGRQGAFSENSVACSA